MNCPEAQEHILEFLDERGSTLAAALEQHLSACPGCSRFLAVQNELDRKLRSEISAPPLGAHFRRSVLQQIKSEPLASELLPDYAHLAGCALATVLCTWMLPYSAGSILAAGTIFTLVTYCIQTAVRGLLENWEEGLQ